MFKRIDLRHFKCFELLKLPLRPLTLLSGLNATGKSSVLQAFALLHQTVREHEWSSRLMLNGNAVRLGTAGDVIDQVTGRLGCGIGLVDDDAEYQWDFEAERREMSLAIRRVAINEQVFTDEDDALFLHQLLPEDSSLEVLREVGFESLGDALKGKSECPEVRDSLSSLCYLTAERTGPRDTYPLEDPQYAPVVGPRGEHTASVLHNLGDRDVIDALAIEGTPPTRQRQVGARMAHFFPGCELEVSTVPQANSVRLGIRTSQQTDFHRPGHTGFGVTQVLPIVVAALTTESGYLLMIENPEVHLHPAGQATMGEFLGEVAAAGVQVVLETHSDHVLNGVRRAVKRGALSADDAAIHFFRSRQEVEEHGGAQVFSPRIGGDGNIDNWPDGFFDQFDKDMSYFADWS